MKRLILLASAFCLLSSILLAADGIIRRLAWTVETSAPVARTWSLIYGETVDLEVCYVSHVRTMDLTGSAVILHCRTNGMAEGYSFQTTGTVMAARGWARVRVAVDSLLPPNLTLATYAIEATQAGTTNLLTAYGTFKLSGSGAGTFSAPLPSPLAASLSLRIDALGLVVTQALTLATAAVTPAQLTAATGTLASAASVTNLSLTLSSTTQTVASTASQVTLLTQSVSSVQSILSSTTGTVASVASQVTNLELSVASVESVLSTNQWIAIDSIPASASRLIVAPGILQTTDTNGVTDLWRIAPMVTNVTFSEDFEETETHTKPSQASYVYPFSEGEWSISDGFMGESHYWFINGPNLSAWIGGSSSLGPYTGPASGYAYLNSLVPTNHITRLASTNDVAAAIAAWMNSPEAGQWVTAAAANAAQSAVANHTNSPTHLITGDRALIDSIPNLTAAPVWNNLTNMSGSVTLTNALEAPIYLHATGAVSIAFSGLRTPLPVYLVVRSPASVSFPTNTYFVGGGSFQTNRANHYIIWDYASGLYVTPVTTTE